MVKSMTGYGRSESHFQGQTITIEIRAVNHRYLDCTPRLPRVYLFLEDRIKTMVQSHISRGKVEVFVSLENTGELSPKISINHPIAQSYCKVFQELAKEYKIENDLTVSKLVKYPDIFHIDHDLEHSEPMADEILQALQKALHDFDTMRTREGHELEQDILARCDDIQILIQNIQKRSPETVSEYRQKLQKRMEEVLSAVPIDETRVLAEAALYADKIAIDEEIVRVYSHLNQVKLLLKLDGPIGRKLDFLMQEFNRETNTIGSKCNDIEISHWVVDLKAELEKIREQIQNME